MSITIPEDFEVRPIPEGTGTDPVTCGSCGLTWDDAVATSYTPAPSARCPFEAFHEDDPEPVRFDVDFILRFEGEDPDLTTEDVIAAFQDGIRTGVVWHLQGSYGRMAHELIAQGLVTP